MTATTAPDEQGPAATLARLGIDPESLCLDDDGTIVVPGPRARHRELMGVDDPLPALVGIQPGPDHVDLAEPIGAGGMAVVRAGTQLSLSRKVAIKQLHDEAPAVDHAALRNEARALGALEHPNVVPVYMLGMDENRRPLMVMKCVEGTVWGQLVSRDGGLSTPYETSDALEWHLRVLIQVCNAVQYAHERGVVHRDLKLDNVIVGNHGEVYLLDWGLAVALHDASSTHLPAAATIRSPQGTPGYMAPEMAAPDAMPIDHRTDIYQLGACLHHLLTGRYRHEAGSLYEIMELAWESVPCEYGEHVPSALAHISLRATEREPGNRQQSAADFRDAISEFLQHRSSWELARASLERVEQIHNRLADPLYVAQPGDPALYDLFTECRFGLEQARLSWPDNPEARVGQQRLFEEMINHELACRDVSQAERLLQQMPQASDELTGRVAEARSELERIEREQQALREAGREIDLRVGSRDRSLIVMIMGVVWALAWVVVAMLNRSQSPIVAYPLFIGLSLVWGAYVAFFHWRYAHALRSNHVNRAFIALFWCVVVACGLLWPLAWHVRMELPLTMAIMMLTIGGIISMFAICVDRRLLPSGLIFGPAFMVTMLAPDWCFEVMAVAVLFCLVYMGRQWEHGIQE